MQANSAHEANMTTTLTRGSSSTAAVAFAAWGLLTAIPPTLSPVSGSSLLRTPARNATAPPVNERRSLIGMSVATTLSPDFAPLSSQLFGDLSERETSQVEKTVGELRRWLKLAGNWDGEGAVAPDALSLEAAADFIRLLPEALADAEPMLHANGHAGLFWNENSFYADLEFLGGKRIAYFIQHHQDKHKGVLRFDGELVPLVLSTLLETSRIS